MLITSVATGYPRADEPAVQTRGQRGSKGGEVVDGEARRVLVVDDEPDYRFLLAVMLEAAGYEVIEAPHGEAALRLARRSRPQLVITDRMMPVMGGEELITWLRADEETARIPIIMVTATPGGDSRADMVLMKPFEHAELVELVNRLTGTAA